MDLRLIASDIDGTLLGEDHRVSDRTIEVLAAAAAAGVEVVAATGRSHWSALDVLDGVDCIRWIIGSNGATLYDRAADAVVRQHVLDPELSRPMLAEIEAAHPGVAFGWETPDGVWFTPEFLAIRRANAPDAPSLDRFAAPFDAAATDLVKVMVQHPELREMEWLDTLRTILPDQLSASTSGAAFVEVTAPEADKGVALAALCADLGIDQGATIAFGDHSNDLGMLSWVERGFAMANAHPAVLAATTERAPHHLDHGVAETVALLLDQ